MRADHVLRQQVLELLQGGNSHMPFEEAVRDFPAEGYNRRPPNLPYTPWHILEHLRIAQRDILDFVRDPEHESPKWPEGYWPERDAVAGDRDWERTVEAFRTDLADMVEWVADPGRDLEAPLPHQPGYTLLREALVLADHNAYHIGEFAALRSVMGTWPEGR